MRRPMAYFHDLAPPGACAKKGAVVSLDASEERRSLSMRVWGMVQGVGFRDFVWRHALRLDLQGYVRNEADGRSVEVYAEGPPAALSELQGLASRGPRGALVTRVDCEWGAAGGGHPTFTITV